jgi:hypothetical protein
VKTGVLEDSRLRWDDERGRRERRKKETGKTEERNGKDGRKKAGMTHRQGAKNVQEKKTSLPVKRMVYYISASPAI